MYDSLSHFSVLLFRKKKYANAKIENDKPAVLLRINVLEM
jgi:hypothetical protein